MRVFLLAQGSQTRMQALLDTPKQLIDINGEPMLLRTIRLLRERYAGMDIVGVIPDELVWKDVRDAVTYTITQKNPSYYQMDILRNLRSSFDDDRSVFLHGDVMWSPEALAMLLDSPKDFGFCVRGSWNIVTGNGRREVYGLSVQQEGYELLDAILAQPQVTPCFAVKLLWDLVAQLQEVAFERTTVHRLDQIDYTDDVDFPEDLRGAELVEEFLKRQDEVRRWRAACSK